MEHGVSRMVFDENDRDELEMTAMLVLEQMFEKVNLAQAKSFKFEILHDEVFDCKKIRAIAEMED